MWISRKKLKEREDKARDEGMGIGYKLGYGTGQVDAFNRLRVIKEGTLIDRQLDEILRNRQGGNYA